MSNLEAELVPQHRSSTVQRVAILVGVVGSAATLPLHMLVLHDVSAVVLTVIGTIYICFAYGSVGCG